MTITAPPARRRMSTVQVSRSSRAGASTSRPHHHHSEPSEAGGLDARLVKVDETRAILVLPFPDVETEERIKSEVGGPWMREHIVPLLAEPPERASGDVVAGHD